jgi:perosamine synthetase
MIPISSPYIESKAKKYVLKCLNTNWISSQGEYILKFEKSLAKYHGTKYCVATSSCTSAIHLAIKSLGIGKGDEIICPDLTFIAPANMIVLAGAKLKLVDINPETFAIDHHKIEKNINKKTKAILVVHQMGHAADMEPILKIAKKYNLKIIEDNAESIGGKYKGRMLGTIGDVSTLSFFANKIITTGEGGAILTNSKKIANKCYLLRDHGMSKVKKYLHVELGYNYRMTNMQAAIGCSQVEILSKILKIRNKQLSIYKKYLNSIKEVQLRSYKDWSTPIHWLTTITINKKNLRDRLIKFLHKSRIDARQMINPVHEAKHFRKFFNKKNYKNSINISRNTIHLPSSTNLKESEIKFICKKIAFFFKKKFINKIN